MKVFLSSTYTDLERHRSVLIDTLLKMGNIELIAMEYFGSEPNPPVELCKLKVSEAELYVGVFSWRYGSLDPVTKMSMTELEYRTALAKRMPVLLYLTSEDYAVKPSDVDTGRSATKIQKLRKEIMDRHTIQKFTTAEDLARLVAADIHRHLDYSPQKSSIKEVDGPVGYEINPDHPFLLCHFSSPSKVKGKKSKAKEKPSEINEYFDVKIYIDIYEDEGNEEYEKILKNIDRVVYQLHKTVDMPVVPMQNWDENFLIEMRLWGEFWIRATIYFKNEDQPPVHLIRFLNLSLPDSISNE